MQFLLLILAVVIPVFALAIWRAPIWAWALAAAVIALVVQTEFFTASLEFGLMQILGWIPAIALAALSVPSLRQTAIVNPAFGMIKSILPAVSETESQALEAGTVGWDAELFSGSPDWTELRKIPQNTLTEEEQEFLDGPTEELCTLIDDWQVRHAEKEIPEAIWKYACDKGFLGMLISKEHGGLGFSAQAQSLILGKIASRNPDVCTIVMVPNSLGPGELVEKYGTDEQKEHYLPRLAKGKDIPCFALTGSTSGSDAAAMRDIGVVCKGRHEGKEVVGIKLNWEKRYITLSPKATVIGLAFHLFDPDGLLNRGEDIGITVALIPADHKGVRIGERHLPSASAFPNGPNWGKDVFIPMDWVVGGEKRVGEGWFMLMECLSAGRSISLPASGAAGAKAMLRFTSAYARIRKQFGISIGHMEGIEEPMARLVENAYVTEAARGVTAAMVSRGEKPSVISALLKYQSTSRLRQSVNDAMDIHGGRGICDGPSNYLQSAYQMVPVGITVEGANILTRSLITFTQGALRAHPYLYKEISAVQNPDVEAGLEQFEEALGGHVSYTLSNIFGAFFHNVTAGRFAGIPPKSYATAHWYRQLARGSRNFALMADMTVALLGGGMKVRQKVTGRMADALSELYLLSCMLKRFEDDGKPSSDRQILDYCAQNALYAFQQSIKATIDNFPVTVARPLMRLLILPLGARFKPANDMAGKKLARVVLEPGDVRDRLTRHIFVTKDPDDPTGILEHTLPKVIEAEVIEKKLERAIRKGEIRRYHGIDWIADAVEKKIISDNEAGLVREVEELVAKVIAVDHFDPKEVKPSYGAASAEKKKTKNVKKIAAAE